MRASQKFARCSKTSSVKDELFCSKITIPTIRDISVPTNWNDYNFCPITQNTLEIDVIVYNMAKNPKL